LRVFVSHGARDTWIAKQIARCIHDLGVDTFIDAYDIETGDDIEKNAYLEGTQRK
jgi:hypothetical protein